MTEDPKNKVGEAVVVDENYINRINTTFENFAREQNLNPTDQAVIDAFSSRFEGAREANDYVELALRADEVYDIAASNYQDALALGGTVGTSTLNDEIQSAIEGSRADMLEGLALRAEVSELINSRLAEATAGMESDETMTFIRGFLDHHDLVMRNDENGQNYYEMNPDSKIAREGSYMPRAEVYAEGSLLEDDPAIKPEAPSP